MIEGSTWGRPGGNAPAGPCPGGKASIGLSAATPTSQGLVTGSGLPAASGDTPGAKGRCLGRTSGVANRSAARIPGVIPGPAKRLETEVGTRLALNALANVPIGNNAVGSLPKPKPNCSYQGRSRNSSTNVPANSPGDISAVSGLVNISDAIFNMSGFQTQLGIPSLSCKASCAPTIPAVVSAAKSNGLMA